MHARGCQFSFPVWKCQHFPQLISLAGWVYNLIYVWRTIKFRSKVLSNSFLLLLCNSPLLTRKILHGFVKRVLTSASLRWNRKIFLHSCSLIFYFYLLFFLCPILCFSVGSPDMLQPGMSPHVLSSIHPCFSLPNSLTEHSLEDVGNKRQYKIMPGQEEKSTGKKSWWIFMKGACITSLNLQENLTHFHSFIYLN